MTTHSMRIWRLTLLQCQTSHSILRAASTQSILISTPLLSYRRHASSTSTTATSSRPSIKTQSTNIARKPSKINGPPSTLPPPLDMPTRQPNQAYFPTYLLGLGKAYLSFYKTSVKNIWANYRAFRTVRSQLFLRYKSVPAAVDAGFLDRHDFQLLHRTWFDIKRVPIFALIFLVCGEFTPLVVLSFTSVVPYASRIPKQIAGDRQKLEDRRAISFRNLTMELPKVGTAVQGLERMQLLHISWSLGLCGRFWDWLGGRLPGLPTPIIRQRVKKRVDYLNLDDELIYRGGGVGEMNIEEVKIALAERGVDILGRSEKELRSLLNLWLICRKETSMERLLLTRPPVWPSRKSTDKNHQ